MKNGKVSDRLSESATSNIKRVEAISANHAHELVGTSSAENLHHGSHHMEEVTEVTCPSRLERGEHGPASVDLESEQITSPYSRRWGSMYSDHPLGSIACNFSCLGL